MTSGDRVSYWQPVYPAGSTRLDATWVIDLGDGISRLSVLLPSAERTVVEATQCDPAQPTAGCWSEIPA
jgi:hypothetical protein